MAFQYVYLSLIIQSNKTIGFYFQRHCPYWMINVPLYNNNICLPLHGPLSEYYVTNSICDRYNLMCSIESHEREHKYINDGESSGGGIPLPYNSTRDVLLSFSLTRNFIYICLKSFKTNYMCRTTMYLE